MFSASLYVYLMTSHYTLLKAVFIIINAKLCCLQLFGGNQKRVYL